MLLPRGPQLLTPSQGPLLKALGGNTENGVGGGWRLYLLLQATQSYPPAPPLAPLPLHPLIWPCSWKSCKGALALKTGWPRFWAQNDEVYSWKDNSNDRCDLLLEPVFQGQQSLLPL